MVLRGQITFARPVFNGTVKVSSQRVDSPSLRPSPLLAKMDRVLLAAARICVSQHPPVASFGIVFVSEVRKDQRPVLPINVTTLAAGALQTCLAPTYETLAPVPGSFRPGTALATTIVVTSELRAAAPTLQ